MSIVLVLHSYWRWVVLVLAVAAIGKAVVGRLRQQKWEPLDNRLGLFYTAAFDIQLLLGLILYVSRYLSPDTIIRYGGSFISLSMDHVVTMVIALVIAHIARSRSKKRSPAAAQHQMAAIGFFISLVLVVMAIPAASW
jgi:hypothetical protein